MQTQDVQEPDTRSTLNTNTNTNTNTNNETAPTTNPQSRTDIGSTTRNSDTNTRVTQLRSRVESQLGVSPVPPSDAPTPERLIERLDGLRTSEKMPALTNDQKKAIKDLGEDERRMFDKTLDELDAYRRGNITQSQYQLNVMSHAAQISGDQDGKKFVKLVGMAFSEPGGEYSYGNAQRTAAGTPVHPAGQLLEGTLQRLTKAKGGINQNDGYNPNILDTNANSTVTHHFGAFLETGAYRGASFGRWAQDQIDGDENPGDVRNGYFASMLGESLANGRISPTDAINLTRWAMTNQDQKGPPWGTTQGGTDLMRKAENYNINDWLAEYRKAH